MGYLAIGGQDSTIDLRSDLASPASNVISKTSKAFYDGLRYTVAFPGTGLLEMRFGITQIETRHRIPRFLSYVFELTK